MSEEQAKTPESVPESATPVNESAKGVKPKKLLNGGVDPAVGEKTRIKKGERRNPNGRPKKTPLSTAAMKIGLKRVPKALVAALAPKFPGIQYGVTYAELGLVGQYMQIASGKTENLEAVAILTGEWPRDDQKSQAPVINFGRIELEDGSARQQLSNATDTFRERIAKRQREGLVIEAN